MTEPSTETLTEDIRGEANALAEEQALLDELLLEDVLIEDISIDGMCGVY
jgi:mycofactocin precursor